MHIAFVLGTKGAESENSTGSSHICACSNMWRKKSAKCVMRVKIAQNMISYTFLETLRFHYQL